MKLRWRAATAADAAACHDLDQRCFPPGVAYDLESFQRLCADAAVKWVAQSGPALVGFIVAEVDRRKNIGLIITIDVEPAFRRQGIGSRLMDLAEADLAALGVAIVYLHMYTPHREAMSMYRRRGYHVVGPLPSYYGPGSDALLMMKNLNPN